MAKRRQKKIKNQEKKPSLKYLIKAETEDGKRKIMWAGVAIVMVIILGFWLFNLNTIFAVNKNKSSDNNATSFNWEEVKGQIKTATDQMKQGLAEIKNLQSQMTAEKATSTESSAGQIKIDELKQRLLENATSTQ